MLTRDILRETWKARVKQQTCFLMVSVGSVAAHLCLSLICYLAGTVPTRSAVPTSLWPYVCVQLCGEGSWYRLQLIPGIEAGGGGRQMWVPCHPCGFLFVLAVVHIQLFFFFLE